MLDRKQEELISAYFDGELAGEELAQAERLLAHDPQARQLLAELELLRKGLRSIPRERLGIDLADRVLSAGQQLRAADVEGAVGGRRVDDAGNRRRKLFSRESRVWRPLVYASLTAAAAVLVALFNRTDDRDVAMAPPGGSDRIERIVRDEEAEAKQPARPLPESSVRALPAPRMMSAKRGGQESSHGGGETEAVAGRAAQQEQAAEQVSGDAGQTVFVVQCEAATGSGAVRYLDELFSQNSVHVEQRIQVARQSKIASNAQYAPQGQAQRGSVIPQFTCLVTANRGQLNAVMEQLHTPTSPIKQLNVSAEPESVLITYGMGPSIVPPPEQNNLSEPANVLAGKDRKEPTTDQASKRRGPVKLPEGVHAGTSQMLPLQNRPMAKSAPAAADDHAARLIEDSAKPPLQVGDSAKGDRVDTAPIQALFIVREQGAVATPMQKAAAPGTSNPATPQPPASKSVKSEAERPGKS